MSTRADFEKAASKAIARMALGSGDVREEIGYIADAIEAAVIADRKARWPSEEECALFKQHLANCYKDAYAKHAADTTFMVAIDFEKAASKAIARMALGSGDVREEIGYIADAIEAAVIADRKARWPSEEECALFKQHLANCYKDAYAKHAADTTFMVAIGWLRLKLEATGLKE